MPSPRWKRVLSMRFRRDRNGSTSPSGTASAAFSRAMAEGSADLQERPGSAAIFSRDRSSRAGLRAKSFVLDGEIVVPVEAQFSFDDLLQRIHPAASRIKKLAEKTPALYLAFDLLKDGRTEVAAKRLSDTAPTSDQFRRTTISKIRVFRLSPASLKLSDAEGWLESAGGGSDGVIAKRLDLAYQAGTREGMQKIKRYRTADCVIGGFRYAEKKQVGRKVVGSLLFGLYDNDGLLHHVGFSSGH